MILLTPLSNSIVSQINFRLWSFVLLGAFTLVQQSSQRKVKCWCVYGKCDASIGKEPAWNTNVLQFAECKKALQFVMINLWQNEKYDHNAFCAKHELFAFFKDVHFCKDHFTQGGYFKMRFFRGHWKREFYVWRLFHALNDPSHSIILPQKGHIWGLIGRPYPAYHYLSLA